MTRISVATFSGASYSARRTAVDSLVQLMVPCTLTSRYAPSLCEMSVNTSDAESKRVTYWDGMRAACIHDFSTSTHLVPVRFGLRDMLPKSRLQIQTYN